MRAIPVIAYVILLMGSSPARAAEVPAEKNAALQYWLAFDCLPRHNDLPEDERYFLQKWDTAPFTPENVKALARYQSSLKYLHRGAEMSDCVWPTALNHGRDGYSALMPQHDARTLAAAALMRARYRFEQGNLDAAFGDVLAVLKLARHVGRDGGILGLLIERGVEILAIKCVAANIWAVNDPDQIRGFMVRWASIPKPTTVESAIATERDHLIAWYKTRGSQVGSDAEPDLAGRTPTVERKDRMGTTRYLLGLQSEAASVKEFTTAIERHYGHAILSSRLPLQNFREAEKKLYEELNKNQPKEDRQVELVRLLVPPVYKLRLNDAWLEVNRVMLRTSLIAKRDGIDVTKAGNDPFGNGPFEVIKSPSGYELRSKINLLLDEALREKLVNEHPKGLVFRTVRPIVP